jgi:VWFA-related protein
MSWFPLVLLCATVPARPPQEPIYRFGVEVRTVYVDVFVTHKGKYVTGLTAGDFEIYDRGVRQETDMVDLEVMPMSVMLLLDVSASVFGRKLMHLRTAARAFIEGLREGDEAGLLSFSYEWRLSQPPSPDFAGLLGALKQQPMGGPTAIQDALYAGLKLVEVSKGRPLILLFTDGVDTASWLSESDLLEAAKASDAVVHSVGIRSPDRDVVSQVQVVDHNRFGSTDVPKLQMRTLKISSVDRWQFLSDIAEATGGQVWLADSSEGLKDVYLSVLEDMESRYLLSYQPQERPEPGWHDLEVKLRNGIKGTVRARSGYTVSDNP